MGATEVKINSLTGPLYKNHDIYETFETNGIVNNLNNLNNNNNINKPCPGRIETNGHKEAREICPPGFAIPSSWPARLRIAHALLYRLPYGENHKPKARIVLKLCLNLNTEKVM